MLTEQSAEWEEGMPPESMIARTSHLPVLMRLVKICRRQGGRVSRPAGCPMLLWPSVPEREPHLCELSDEPGAEAGHEDAVRQQVAEAASREARERERGEQLAVLQAARAAASTGTPDVGEAGAGHGMAGAQRGANRAAPLCLLRPEHPLQLPNGPLGLARRSCCPAHRRQREAWRQAGVLLLAALGAVRALRLAAAFALVGVAG